MRRAVSSSRANARGEFDTRDTANTILVQNDWDYPGIAGTFGGSLHVLKPGRCRHEGTDGTIDCPGCGTPAGEFIYRASEWLYEHIGSEGDDPGYFGQG